MVPYAGQPNTLMCGGSRVHTSIASATGNKLSATSKEGSRAAAIELWSATDSKFHQRRRKASCMERRRSGGSDSARMRASSRRRRTQSSLQRLPVPAAMTRKRHWWLATRSEYVAYFARCAAVNAADGTARVGCAFRRNGRDDRHVDTDEQSPENVQSINREVDPPLIGQIRRIFHISLKIQI